jgi:tryptophan synthase alpha chain
VSLPAGARRIRERFAAARTEGRPALIVYIVAGHPTEEASLAAAEAALSAGADLLELGIPFSDPVADGPVIAAAARSAAEAGGGPASAIAVARALRGRGHDQPLLGMGYLNPLVARGATSTFREMADAGIDGLIVPDLPAGEDRAIERAIAAAGLGASFLVAPNTTEARIERAIRSSTAFLYVVPLFGVTGARERVADAAIGLLERLRTAARGRLPLAVGFGVSRPEHVRALGPHADGVIVGSAIVDALDRGGPPRVHDLVAALAGEGAHK